MDVYCPWCEQGKPHLKHQTVRRSVVSFWRELVGADPESREPLSVEQQHHLAAICCDIVNTERALSRAAR